MKKLIATVAIVLGLGFGSDAIAKDIPCDTVEMVNNVIETQDRVIQTQQELMETQRILLETVSKVVSAGGK